MGLANDNPYGLAAGVLAKDQAVIDGMVRRIRAGTVWVNTYNVYDAGEQCQFKMGIVLCYITAHGSLVHASAPLHPLAHSLQGPWDIMSLYGTAGSLEQPSGLDRPPMLEWLPKQDMTPVIIIQELSRVYWHISGMSLNCQN